MKVNKHVCVNVPIAPPESFHESVNDSSLCNVDESNRESIALQEKQIALLKMNQQQIQNVIQKKERIFSTKMKTVESVPLKIEQVINFQKLNCGNQQSKNPFSNQNRKFSEIQLKTERESTAQRQSYGSPQQPLYKQNSIFQSPPLKSITKVERSKIFVQPTPKIKDDSQFDQMFSQRHIPILTTQAEETHQYNSPRIDRKQMNTQTCSQQRTPDNESLLSKQYSLKQNSLMSLDKDNDLNKADCEKIETIVSNPNIVKIFNQNPILKQSSISSQQSNLRSPIIGYRKPQTDLQKMIIKATFENDMKRLSQMLQQCCQEQLDRFDICGNTLLILIIKLCGADKKYNELLKEVLKFNPDPFLKNSITGWSALDESLAQRSVYATALLFQQCYKQKRSELTTQYQTLVSVLNQVQNFSLEMSWNFDSPMPLIKMLAPNDTIKLFKHGQSLRLDSTLVGFSKLQCKRRDMSLIFNNGRLYQINRTNNFYTDPLEELDLEEKKLIIHDILNCEPVNGKIDITQCQLKQSTDWRGRPIIETLSGYQTEKYDLKLSIKSSVIKKQNDTQVKFTVERELYKEYLDHNTMPNTNILITNKAVEQVETRTIGLWICKHHPLKFRDFNNIVTFLANGNPLMEKLAKVFQREEIHQLLALDGFPIKIQIPFQFSIYATIVFQNFFQLSRPDGLFLIPDIKYQPRKLAQKTVDQKKKRLLLANLYI